MVKDTHKPETAMDQLDQRFQASIAKATLSMSPVQGLLSYIDWSRHLAISPGKQLELLNLAITQNLALAQYAQRTLSVGIPGTPSHNTNLNIEPPISDKRFAGDAWKQWPFNLMQLSYLMAENWWDEATSDIRGVSQHHLDIVHTAAKQTLYALSPKNFVFSNPEVLQRTIEEKGANLLRGSFNAWQEFMRQYTGAANPKLENFKVGEQLAATPGKVVLRNQLMELIQYTPTTRQVHPEPILIVPAWIMKYYILDLSQHNSLVRHLLDQGYTVFCISWKNPGVEERNMGMDDYLSMGFFESLNAINKITGQQKIHAAGYCLGGTLLAIAAAAMGKQQDDRLLSISLFAAQTDFSEPGELSLFIDDSQLAILEAEMADIGYLTGEQMSGAFLLLRSDMLIWSRYIKEFLLGEESSYNDLMAWNTDTTRMPAKMHSQYLRRLFLHDDLSEGRYPVNGKPVSLTDIHAPVFCLGTETDHIAPWRSVYKIHQLCSSEITFALTNKGHNAGVVSEPGHKNRHYRVLCRGKNEPYLGPDEWLAQATYQEGSWWNSWFNWLEKRSGKPVSPPSMGNPEEGYPLLCDAPGVYIFEK
ncbi:MAG: alpha/beta fold hydrolase [Alcaligenaceae bacterium]|nr:alpha/beta fold hydrolase [Alcaligenaceae bacterium]